MKEAREKIDRQKRKVEDLIILVLTKAKNLEYHPEFKNSDKLHGASKHLQAAANSMWLATVCLMED